MSTKLLQTRTQIEADLVISRLRAAGLHPSELRIWPHVTLAGADLFYTVEVPADEADAANQVIRAPADHGRPVSSPDSLWTPLKLGLVLVLVAIALGMLIP